MPKTPKLGDDEVSRLAWSGIFQSVGYSESKLSKERERVQLYYDGEKPHKVGGSSSGYNSLDVYDGVEDMKAQLLETFSANKRPVRFDPWNASAVTSAKVRTDYATWVLFRRNKGYRIMHDLIQQSLMARNGVVKVWWEPAVKTEYVHLSDTTFEELQAYLVNHADEKPQITETTKSENGETIKRVTIRLTKDDGHICIRHLAGEEFGISPMAESIDTADLVFSRVEMTVSEMLKAGFPADKVHKVQSDDRLWMSMEPEKLARFMPTDDLIGTKVLEDGQEARRVCMVYECYLELDLDHDDDYEDDDGQTVSQLFKVTLVGNTVLDKEPVSFKPFIDFCPLPRANAFWGTNFAQLLIATQNARTYLTRSVVEHAMITNNPRLQVVKGGLMNPRELTENRFGGIVNVTRPNAIIPIEQAGLNPFVYQTINMLKSDKQEKTGISDLSQGLDKDAISKQNSGDMVHELITVSQLRQKIVARNFAENFMVPLFTRIDKLARENEKPEKIARIAGPGWQPEDFLTWDDEATLSVSFALGYGEAEKEAQKWASVHAALSNMPALAAQYTPLQQYVVARHGIEQLVGVEVDSVLLPPNEAKPPPPNPMQQAELAMKQADAKVKEANAQAAVMKLQLDGQKQQQEFQIAMAKLELEKLRFTNDADIKQQQLAHKVAVDAAEIQLQVEAQANDKLQAEAVPTH